MLGTNFWTKTDVDINHYFNTADDPKRGETIVRKKRIFLAENLKGDLLESPIKTKGRKKSVLEPENSDNIKTVIWLTKTL